jgi:type I restriction enzyme, S subunit
MTGGTILPVKREVSQELTLPLVQVLQPLEDGRILHQGWSPQCEREASPSHDVWGVLKTTSVQPIDFYPEHNKRLPSTMTPRPGIEVRAGDILLTNAGPRLRCGVSCLVHATRPRLMISGKIYRFRTKPSVMDAKYLVYYLQSEVAQSAIDQMKTGISDSGLNLTRGKFLNLPVPQVGLDKQVEAVDHIDLQYSRLDAGIVALKRAQANLKRYRASILQAACEGRLVPIEAELARAENRPYETGEQLLQRILTDRRNSWAGKGKYKEPIHSPDGAYDVPEGWAIGAVGEMCAVELGVMLDKDKKTEGQRIPYLRNINVRWGTVDLGSTFEVPLRQKDFARFLVQKGDLLVCEGGEPGRCAVWDGRVSPMAYQKALHRVRPFGGVEVLYLRYAIEHLTSSGWLAQLFTGSTIKHLTKEAFVSVPIALPPAAEQVRIVAEVERLLSVVDKLEQQVATNLARATRLRQAILKKAFSVGLRSEQ